MPAAEWTLAGVGFIFGPLRGSPQAHQAQPFEPLGHPGRGLRPSRTAFLNQPRPATLAPRPGGGGGFRAAGWAGGGNTGSPKSRPSSRSTPGPSGTSSTSSAGRHPSTASKGRTTMINRRRFLSTLGAVGSAASFSAYDVVRLRAAGVRSFFGLQAHWLCRAHQPAGHLVVEHREVQGTRPW